MFKLIRRKSKATIAQLIEQVHAAKREEAATEAAVGTALEAFDDTGAAQDAKVLFAAREAHSLAVEHVGRARRLLPHRVGELAEELIGKHQAAQARLRGPVTAEIQERIASAVGKVQQLEAELATARAAQDAIESELRAVGTDVARHDSAIQQIHRRRDEAMGCDVDDTNGLRRLKLGAELLERQLNGGE